MSENGLSKYTREWRLEFHHRLPKAHSDASVGGCFETGSLLEKHMATAIDSLCQVHS